MTTNTENIVESIDHCSTESADKIIQLLKAEALHHYTLVPFEMIRMLHVVALCKTLLALNSPNSLYGDEGELLKARAEEFGTYSGQAFGMLLAISERLRSWEPGYPEEGLVEAMIEFL